MAEFAAHGANQEEKMAAEKAKKTIVIGHKNPDTDSICSSIAFAKLQQLKGVDAVAVRAGDINKETAYALDYFHVEAQPLVKDF